MKQAQTIGFVGAGNMAEALCRGILHAKLVTPDRVMAADVKSERLEVFARDLGVKTTSDNRAVAKAAEVIILAVKPQNFKDVMSALGPLIDRNKLLISILAGVRCARIESACGAGARVMRAMPNLPMLVGAGMAAVCKGAHATDADLDTATKVFKCAARVVSVAEDGMDAVTAISGSGPAYFFYLVEALIEAGVAGGLTSETAALMAAQTCLGAGRLLLETGEGAAALQARVASPGGTTAAAIEHMEKAHVKREMIAAFRRATERAHELSS